jgi:hypothetical protein
MPPTSDPLEALRKKIRLLWLVLGLFGLWEIWNWYYLRNELKAYIDMHHPPSDGIGAPKPPPKI